MLAKDEDGNTKKPEHTSADDLNDGFILDKDDRRLLSYKVRQLPSSFFQEHSFWYFFQSTYH